MAGDFGRCGGSGAAWRPRRGAGCRRRGGSWSPLYGLYSARNGGIHGAALFVGRHVGDLLGGIAVSQQIVVSRGSRYDGIGGGGLGASRGSARRCRGAGACGLREELRLLTPAGRGGAARGGLGEHGLGRLAAKNGRSDFNRGRRQLCRALEDDVAGAGDAAFGGELAGCFTASAREALPGDFCASADRLARRTGNKALDRLFDAPGDACGNGVEHADRHTALERLLLGRSHNLGIVDRGQHAFLRDRHSGVGEGFDEGV